MTIRVFFPVLIVTASLAPLRGAVASDPTPISLGRALDTWAQPLVERGFLSGNLLVARRDSVLLERSWGMADAAKGVANAPEIPSCVASITKPMTVILAIQLIQEGKLGYTDPLSKWIPGFPQGDSITIEHLLRHRAGIPHRLTSDEDEKAPHTAADMVEFAKKATLTHKPGEKSAYSSGGFSVLARVLELAGGADYGALLRERLLDPLGMARTFHPDARARGFPRAASYVPVAGGVEAAPEQDLSFLVGAGSVFSTTRDLHRLLWADVSGRLGEGARQSALRGSKVSWNGSTNGYRAFAEYDTTTGDAVIFTGNLHCGAVDQMRSAVQRLLAGEAPDAPVLPPARAAKVAPALLRSYEGLYDVAGNPRLAVRATATGLDVNGWALLSTSDSTFFSLRDFATVKAVGGGKGPIERFDWMLGGQSWPCPRVGDLP
jgi:CubicO group peptidase (beta-lactamase class C family)